MSGIVKWVYVGMLGVVLVIFLGGRMFEDVGAINETAGTWWLILDLALAIPILVFYSEYAWSSLTQDSADAIQGAD